MAKNRDKERAIKKMRSVGVPGSLQEKKGRWYYVVAKPGDKRRSHTLADHTGMSVTNVKVAGELAIVQWEEWQTDSAALSRGWDGKMTSVAEEFLVYSEGDFNATKKPKVARNAINERRVAVDAFVEFYIAAYGDTLSGIRRVRVEVWQDQLRIEGGYVRVTCNKKVGHVKGMFEWASKHEYITEELAAAIQMVKPLKKGQPGVVDNPPVEAVAKEDVLAILPYCTDVLRAMLTLQLYSGMRPCEIITLKPSLIIKGKKNSDPWTYDSAESKTVSLGRERFIALGPKCQLVLKPYLNRKPSEYCFSPQESEDQRRGWLTEQRETPDGQGNSVGTNRKAGPKRKPGKRFETHTYARSLKNAINRAKADGVAVQHFSPNQIRHHWGELITRELGIESAAAHMDHADTKTTEKFYAHHAIKEQRRVLSQEVAKKFG